MTPPIRPATRDDAAELARLLSPLGYPRTADEVAAVWEPFEGEGDVALVAEGADGELAGMVTLHRMTVLHRDRPVGRITALAVDDGAQGRGVGRALLASAEEVARRWGCCMIEVTSHERRAEAHAFYRHMGYERTSYRFARVLA